MKKYLEEMTKEELIEVATKEGIVLGLKYDRFRIVEQLVEKGYVNSKLDEIEKEVEEIDFSSFEFERKSRRSYRNYPNKKQFRILQKKLRVRKRKSEFEKAIDFNFIGLNEDQIKRRLVETEINKSKYSRGSEYEGISEESIFFDKAPLPNSYLVDEVVLMPKNPTTLYVYWEIKDETFEKLMENNDIVDNIIIKILKNGEEYKKIIRHERIGSHYIGDVDTSQSYEAYIGYEDTYGNFSEVAHSSYVIAPSDKLSDNIDLLWGTVKEDKNTNQLIKYINSPVPTPENIEFLELSESPIITEDDDEFVVEVLERLLQVGASESLLERKIIKDKRTIKPDRLDMSGFRSS